MEPTTVTETIDGYGTVTYDPAILRELRRPGMGSKEDHRFTIELLDSKRYPARFRWTYAELQKIVAHITCRDFSD